MWKRQSSQRLVVFTDEMKRVFSRGCKAIRHIRKRRPSDAVRVVGRTNQKRERSPTCYPRDEYLRLIVLRLESRRWKTLHGNPLSRVLVRSFDQ